MMRARSFVIGVVMLAVLNSSARGAGITAGAQGGIGYIPLSDWDDFVEEFSDGSYENDGLGVYWEVWAAFRFDERHGIRLSVERITTSASADAIFYFNPFVTPAGSIDWDFETVPICLTYELELRRSNSNARTIVGLGAGIYLTDVEATATTDDPLFDESQSDTRSGEGYGFHGYLRQTVPLAERLSMSAMLRMRWADGMGFSDDEGDIPIEFTGVDIGVGLEWEF